MLSEDSKALITHISSGVIEGLKFIPAGEVEEAVALVQKNIAEADFTDTTGDPIKILHSAVECGVIISKATPTEKDDKVFGKIDQILDEAEANGGNIFLALLTALVKRIKK